MLKGFPSQCGLLTSICNLSKRQTKDFQ